MRALWRRLRALGADRVIATRPVSGLCLIAMIAAQASALLLTWAWLYQWPAVFRLQAASHGLIQPILVAAFLELALTWSIARGLGGLTWRELGITRREVLVGVAVTAVAWAVVQVGIAVVTIASDGLAWAPGWDQPLSRIGALLGQFPGGALKEEVFYRGFLFAQGVLLARRLGARGPAAWVIAIVVTQTIFALGHLPQREIVQHLHGLALVESLAQLVWSGAVFCLLYVRTGNLVVVAGLHALGNEPLALVDSPWRWMVVQSVVAALFVVWPLIERDRAR